MRKSRRCSATTMKIPTQRPAKNATCTMVFARPMSEAYSCEAAHSSETMANKTTIRAFKPLILGTVFVDSNTLTQIDLVPVPHHLLEVE